MINIKSKKTYIKNGLLHFNYVLDLNYKVNKENVLYINIEDDENYFILLLAKNAIKFHAPFKTEQVLNKQSVAFYTNLPKATEPIKEMEIGNIQEIEELDEVKKEETYFKVISEEKVICVKNSYYVKKSIQEYWLEMAFEEGTEEATKEEQSLVNYKTGLAIGIAIRILRNLGGWGYLMQFLFSR